MVNEGKEEEGPSSGVECDMAPPAAGKGSRSTIEIRYVEAVNNG